MLRNESQAVASVSRVNGNSSNATNIIYREVPGFENDAHDVLQQLNANLNKLEDLYGRLHFVLVEVQSNIRVK